MNRPRVAYLFSRYPIVSQTFCDNEILGLEEAGWDLVVASLNPPLDDFQHQRLDALKAPVLYPPPPAALRELEDRARAAGSWPRALIDDHAKRFGAGEKPELRCRNALWLARQLPKLGIDHVHLHFANRATHTVLFLKELSGIPFSFTPQAQDFLVDMARDLLAELCREAAFVVAPCDFALEKLAEMCPDSAGKMVRIYNGIEPAGYRQAQPNPDKDTIRIASCGRLIEFKGFHHLIAAAAGARTAGVRVELELLGDGPWRERLENQVDALDLRDRVNFRGTVGLDEMKAEFERIDAFVLACVFSEQGASDMFPTVVTEAMLTGLPVVSTRVAGVPELVIDGETGILLEPGDETGLTDSLVRLAREPGLAAKLGKAGRQRAVEVFSRQVTLPQLEARIEAIVTAPKPAPASPRLAAFCDLTESSAERVNLELPVIGELAGSCWLAGGRARDADLAAIGDLESAGWLPDGLVLEMEWRSRDAERVRLIELREKLSTSIDGETFFAAARRALWWSGALRRRGGAELLYAPDADACLVVWLAGWLTGIPFVAAIEGENVFAKDLRGRILAAARAVAIQSGADPLLRAKRRAKPAIRREALQKWLGQALA